MIDTKSLHDWALEAGISLRDDDGYYDAEDVWITKLMVTPETLNECWAEFCFEYPERVLEMLKAVGEADSDLMVMANGASLRGTDTLQFAYANSAIGRAARAGECLRRMIRDGLTKHVKDHAEEWWEDVQAYAADMERGAREDWEYDNYRDRLLEGDR